MALSLQLGYPSVPKSRTNPNVNLNDALDIGNPMPFLTFIKIINVSFEPDSLQEYYNYYLRVWNEDNNSKEEDNNAVIVERYRDFIKEITLNYTTPEEKKFLSKIDFSDPYDLDIALGFYGRKLIELSRFYNNKRNDVKFNSVRNKLRGTNYGTEKTLTELTLSYLKNLDGGKIVYDYDAILTNLEIEIEELYDTYPLYFDQEPDEKIYDNKDLDYGYDIFLKTNTELISSIFGDMSQELIDLKEINDLIDNKRSLTEKYIATDFYYLSTGETTADLVSGKLFEADNKVMNFLNRDYPTTASTESTDYLESSRLIGFFRPHKTSIILVDGKNLSYSFNTPNLEPNSVYYFPDPSKYGDNGDILTFTVDDSFLKRNYSSGNAVNQPYSSPTDTKYYGYVSKIEQNKHKYLDQIFDSGFIRDVKSDIYNNLFGLFKNDHRFRKNVEIIDDIRTYNLLVNGYKFYDDMYDEGFLFQYTPDTTYDDTTYTQTIRTGLSTYTGVYLPTPNPEITFFGGYFTPYNELIEPSESNLVPTYQIFENAYILDGNGIPFPDAISSDLSAFEYSPGTYYYTELIEGGINDSDPLQRALLDSSTPYLSSLSAKLVEYPRTSAINIVDGGYTIDYDFDIKIGGLPTYALLPSTINPTVYTLSTYPYQEDYALSGKMFVRNSYTKDVHPLLESFPYLNTKYPSDIVSQLQDNVIRFEVGNDVLFVETINYLTIDKISMEDGQFIDPKTESFYIEHSMGDFDKVSNRFKKNNDVYYCRLQSLTESVSSNDFVIYPEIWKFDLINFEQIKIFPLSIDEVTQNIQFFSVSGADVRYTNCDQPTLAYNSRNNIFNISYLIKDQNHYPVLHSYDFHLQPDVVFMNHNINKFSEFSTSNIMNDISTLTLFLSSTPITTISEELIV